MIVAVIREKFVVLGLLDEMCHCSQSCWTIELWHLNSYRRNDDGK